MKPLKLTCLIGLLSIISLTKTLAQTPELIISSNSKSDAFSKIVEVLIDHEYYINNLDQEVGWIQVRYTPLRKKFFGKDWTQYNYNLFILPLSDNQLKIKIQGNVQTLDDLAGYDKVSYIYRDNGISKKPEDYQKLLELLKEVDF